MGVKYLCSFCIVCFTVLWCVSGDFQSTSSLSAEEEAPTSESYEETTKSLQYDDDSALEATHDAGDGTAEDYKRYPEPIQRQDRETSGNGPYFMPRLQQQQQQQQQHQPKRHQHQNQQQQQQQQHHHHKNSPGLHHSHQYHQQGRAPVDQYGFGASDDAVDDGRVNNVQSDGFYQPGGGGGDSINFDVSGFKDFSPSVSFRSSTLPPSVPSPSSPFIGSSGQHHLSPFTPSSAQHHLSPFTPSPQHYASPFTASPQHHSTPFDDGPNVQMSLDLTGLGYDSSSPSGYGRGGIGSGGGGGVSGGSSGSSGNSAYAPSYMPNGYNYGSSQQAPVVHKSVYVHVAPPDDEPPRKQRVIVPNVPPKKNYQIVFIKAPTSPPPTAPIIPPPPQNSDKTLIYVLHPKPEEAPPIHIPPPPVTQPLKPEVYFIKYKHREEPHSGGGGGGGGGGGAQGADYGPSHGGGDFGTGHGGLQGGVGGDYGPGGGGGGGGGGLQGGDYGSGHGGALPSPGEDFGAGDSSGGYLHRRYGRGDQAPEQSTQSPFTQSPLTQAPLTQSSLTQSLTTKSMSARPPPATYASSTYPSSTGQSSAVYQLSTRQSSASPSSTSTAATAYTTTNGDSDESMTPEQREMFEGETTAMASATDAVSDLTTTEETSDEQSQGGYSTEYNDASVDSTNLSETHVMSTTPKGKNGH